MENSKMVIIICPTTTPAAIDNLNAVLRVAELSGGMVFEPHDFVEDFYYGIINRAEKEREKKLSLHDGMARVTNSPISSNPILQ